MADDFGIRPARDPYPPSEPVAKARDAAIERAEAEVQRLRDALEREKTKRGIAFSFIPAERHEEYADRLMIVDDPGQTLANGQSSSPLAQEADRGS